MYTRINTYYMPNYTYYALFCSYYTPYSADLYLFIQAFDTFWQDINTVTKTRVRMELSSSYEPLRSPLRIFYPQESHLLPATIEPITYDLLLQYHVMH
jgi:hypothetical protein